MKRFLSVVLLCVLLLSAVACTQTGGTPSESQTSTDIDIGSISASVSGSMSGSYSVSDSMGLGASSSVMGGGDDEPPVAVEGGAIPIILDGVMQYDIVYENSAVDQAVLFIKELARLGIKTKDGRTFDANNYLDFCTRDTRIKNNNSQDTLQIYIGNTLFEESQTTAADLRYRDYVIKKIGNKLVVVAGSADVLNNAVSNSLVLGIRKVNGNARCITEKTSIANYSLKEVTICGVALKNFSILYADGTVSLKRYGVTTTFTYEDYAKELQSRLQNDYGFVLPIKKASSTAEGKNEILVGPTNRSLSSSVSTPKEQHYAMKTAGTQVALKCFGASSYACLDDSFAKYLIRQADAEKNVSVAAGVNYTALSGNIDQTDISQAAGTLRVMSYNVQSQLQGWMPDGATAATVAERKETFYGLIYLVQADVIGFQEVTGGKGGGTVTVSSGKTSGSWAYELPKWMSDLGYDYKFTNGHEASSGSPLADGKTSTISHNIVAWRKDKFTAKAWGVHSFTNVNNPATRNFGWVLLEGKSGTALAGQQFIFISGHWDFADTETGSRTLQHKQGTEMGQKINTLVSKYNCPVIAVADYNCPRDVNSINTADGKPTNQAITNLLTTGNMEDTRPLALKNGGTTAAENSPGGCVDHIFIRKGFGTDCVFFKTLSENGIAGISDHRPLLADIKLRG